MLTGQKMQPAVPNLKKRHLEQSTAKDTFQVSSSLQKVGRYYKEVQPFDKGSFGQIYPAYLPRQDGYHVKVALKMFNFLNDPQKRMSFEAEVETFKKINGHPHIVRLYDCLRFTNHGFLVMRFYSTDFQKFWNDRDSKSKTETDIRFYFSQILQGCLALHLDGLVHQDLRPKNILVDTQNGCTVKLCDMGLVESVDSCQFQLRYLNQTKQTNSPEIKYEVIEYQKKADKADVWSLGAILYWMLEGEYPFGSNNPPKSFSDHQKKLGKTISSNQGHIYDDFETLSSIAKKCLSFYPQHRPSVKQLCNLRIFQLQRIATSGYVFPTGFSRKQTQNSPQQCTEEDLFPNIIDIEYDKIMSGRDAPFIKNDQPLKQHEIIDQLKRYSAHTQQIKQKVKLKTSYIQVIREGVRRLSLKNCRRINQSLDSLAKFKELMVYTLEGYELCLQKEQVEAARVWVEDAHPQIKRRVDRQVKKLKNQYEKSVQEFRFIKEEKLEAIESLSGNQNIQEIKEKLQNLQSAIFSTDASQSTGRMRQYCYKVKELAVRFINELLSLLLGRRTRTGETRLQQSQNNILFVCGYLRSLTESQVLFIRLDQEYIDRNRASDAEGSKSQYNNGLEGLTQQQMSDSVSKIGRVKNALTAFCERHQEVVLKCGLETKKKLQKLRKQSSSDKI